MASPANTNLARLKFLRTFPMSEHMPEWAMRCFDHSLRHYYVALPKDDQTMIVYHIEDPTNILAEVKIEKAVSVIALHPDLQYVAVIDNRRIMLKEPTGVLHSRTVAPPEWGDLKAISFDQTGSMVLISSEMHSEDGSYAGCKLILLETDTLSVIGTLDIQGGFESYHQLLLHPTLPIIGVEISCEQESAEEGVPVDPSTGDEDIGVPELVSDQQDGTWLSFVRYTPLSLELLNCIESPEAFYATGFSPDGCHVAGVHTHSLQVWSFPDCCEVAYVESEPEECFAYVSRYSENRLVLAIFSEEIDGWRRQIRSIPDLTVVSDKALTLQAENKSVEIVGPNIFLANYVVGEAEQPGNTTRRSMEGTFDFWKIL